MSKYEHTLDVVKERVENITNQFVIEKDDEFYYSIEALQELVECEKKPLLMDNQFLNKLMNEFRGSFINASMELILIPKTNIYFILKDCKSELDIKCKLLEWCSRTIYKGVPYKNKKTNKEYRIENLKHLNNVLGTLFNEYDIELIYQYLGNCVNHYLTIKFIESGYDLSVLKES